MLVEIIKPKLWEPKAHFTIKLTPDEAAKLGTVPTIFYDNVDMKTLQGFQQFIHNRRPFSGLVQYVREMVRRFTRLERRWYTNPTINREEIIPFQTILRRREFPYPEFYFVGWSAEGNPYIARFNKVYIAHADVPLSPTGHLVPWETSDPKLLGPFPATVEGELLQHNYAIYNQAQPELNFIQAQKERSNPSYLLT